MARIRAAVEILLSDRGRWLLAPILALALGLMWRDYGLMVGADKPSVRAFRANPVEYVGRLFSVDYGRVARAGDLGFRLRKGRAEIDVWAEDADVVIGEIVSVRGPIRPDLKLEAREIRVHHGRQFKWLLGVLVLGCAAVVAVYSLRTDA